MASHLRQRAQRSPHAPPNPHRPTALPPLLQEGSLAAALAAGGDVRGASLLLSSGPASSQLGGAALPGTGGQGVGGGPAPGGPDVQLRRLCVRLGPELRAFFPVVLNVQLSGQVRGRPPCPPPTQPFNERFGPTPLCSL
jgi:hypothetical protein